MKSPLLAEAQIDRNLQFWQPRSPRKLTREDARQIATNMTRFFGILANRGESLVLVAKKEDLPEVLLWILLDDRDAIQHGALEILSSAVTQNRPWMVT